MRHLKKQRGMTGLGWLIVLSLIGFFVFLGLKIYPIYWENYNVRGSLASLAKTSGISRMPKSRIRGLLLAKFNINNIRTIGIKNIKIGKRKGVVSVAVNYTVKVPLAGALSLLAEFNERIEASN